MKTAKLSLRKNFAATEVNETLGERFKEFTSHSAWSLLKAAWISTPISKASRSSTQNSDHPQLSHTCSGPPSRVKGSSVDPEFPISLLLIFPDLVETTLSTGGSCRLERKMRGESNCSSAHLTTLWAHAALQGRWTLGNLWRRWLPGDSGDNLPQTGQRSPMQMNLAPGRSLRREITLWREIKLRVAPWWGAVHLPCLHLPGNPVVSQWKHWLETLELQMLPCSLKLDGNHHTPNQASHDPHPFLSLLSLRCSGWKIPIHL